MAPCQGAVCSSYGFETLTNPETVEIHGAYKKFIETIAFLIFAVGVALNTGILTILISTSPNLDYLDGYFMNLCFGELISSFGIVFVFFVQFTTSISPIGDGGCKFLAWLGVTSVTITITSLLLVAYELHHLALYNRTATRNRCSFISFIVASWVVAALPGIPYMVTAAMGNGNYCVVLHWSNGAEVLFISFMIVFQIVIPLAILVMLFGRIFLALRPQRDGDAILEEESHHPGSEANFQRAVLKRKALLTFFIAVFFFFVLLTVSLVDLSLTLDLDHVKGSSAKYARIREGNRLMECIKCIFVPMFYMAYYDKLRNQFRKLVCRRHRNEEAYNSLRYNVYQQTVHDQNNETNDTGNFDIEETERDDVAILDNAT